MSGWRADKQCVYTSRLASPLMTGITLQRLLADSLRSSIVQMSQIVMHPTDGVWWHGLVHGVLHYFLVLECPQWVDSESRRVFFDSRAAYQWHPRESWTCDDLRSWYAFKEDFDQPFHVWPFLRCFRNLRWRARFGPLVFKHAFPLASVNSNLSYRISIVEHTSRLR